MVFSRLTDYLEPEPKMLQRVDLKNLKYFLKCRVERY